MTKNDRVKRRGQEEAFEVVGVRPIPFPGGGCQLSPFHWEPPPPHHLEVGMTITRSE